MRLHAASGMRGVVYDLDTGRPVRKVIWVDEEKGELEAYRVDARGEIAKDGLGNYLTYTAKGRFKWMPRESPPPYPPGAIPKKVREGAPKCARCPSLLTLPGEDLCVECRAKDRAQRNPMKVERLNVPLLSARCSAYGCSNLASFVVSDEVEVSPAVVPNPNRGFLPGAYGRAKRLAFDRGATVGRRYYCARHYRPPRLLDAKGEVVVELEDCKIHPDLK